MITLISDIRADRVAGRRSRWITACVGGDAASSSQDHPYTSSRQARLVGPVPQPAIPTRLLPSGQSANEERSPRLVSPAYR